VVEWKADLDALVEETMAFARSVHVQPAMPRAIVEPNQIPPIDWNKSEREGIQARLANFRAHQLRFESEREDHAAAELKRMWASRS
jgi:hypothetical protein